MDDNKTLITSNAHNNKDYFRARRNKERMETKRNYQDKLAANRYATLSNDGEDNWSTHTTQYEERGDAQKNGSEWKSD